jgi:hypothetical protein
VARAIEPESAWRDVYGELYEAFGRLYPALRSLRDV